MTDGMLFDTSPVEDEDTKKKKPTKRKKKEEPTPPAGNGQKWYERGGVAESGYLLSIDSVPCDQCGAPADLVEIVKARGAEKWRVMCGWWCMHSWLIDPMPELLDKADKETKEFVMREGRFSGKTFDEIDAIGGRQYIVELAKLAKRKTVAEAASEWLAKKKALTQG